MPDLRRLPRDLRGRLTTARRLAAKRGVSLYLVGGAVRDLLLGRAIVDTDLAVDGDGIAFGRALGRELGARARVHERFATVALEFPDGAGLDVASTRSETYASPGSLPEISPAALERDLARRDFTINAMAVRIAPGRPALVDPFGGARDIAKKLVRMLHPGSPHDDPTRAFRAVRYANRLDFSIAPRTREWIRAAIDASAFEAISGDRLRRELRLLFSEKNRARAARQMRRLGLDRAVDPSLTSGPDAIRRLGRAEAIAGRHWRKTGWFLFLLVWTAELDAAGAERMAGRLSLAGDERRKLIRWPSILEELRREGPRLTVTRILASGFSRDEIAAAAALGSGRQARVLERALASLDAALSIRGRDLLAAGVPAGPRIGRALAKTLEALREGRISAPDELDFAVAAATREVS